MRRPTRQTRKNGRSATYILYIMCEETTNTDYGMDLVVAVSVVQFWKRSLLARQPGDFGVIHIKPNGVGRPSHEMGEARSHATGQDDNKRAREGEEGRERGGQ